MPGVVPASPSATVTTRSKVLIPWYLWPEVEPYSRCSRITSEAAASKSASAAAHTCTVFAVFQLALVKTHLF